MKTMSFQKFDISIELKASNLVWIHSLFAYIGLQTNFGHPVEVYLDLEKIWCTRLLVQPRKQRVKFIWGGRFMIYEPSPSINSPFYMILAHFSPCLLKVKT